MNVRYFNSSDYEILIGWWKKHNHPEIPLSALPLGVLVSNNDSPVCVSFLYTMDNCDMCQIGWTTTNPDAGLKEKYNAIDLSIDSLLIVAKKLNKKHIMDFSNSKGLSKMLKRKGFNKNSEHDLYTGVL